MPNDFGWDESESQPINDYQKTDAEIEISAPSKAVQSHKSQPTQVAPKPPGASLKDGNKLSLEEAIAEIAAGALRSADPGREKNAQAFLVSHLIGNYLSRLGLTAPPRVDVNGHAPVVKGEGFPGEKFFDNWRKNLVDRYIANVGGSRETEQLIEMGRIIREIVDEHQTKVW